MLYTPEFKMAINWLLAVFSVLLLACCGTTDAQVICVCSDKQCLLDNHNCLPLAFQVLIQEQEFAPGTNIKFGDGTYTVSGNDSVNYNMVVRNTRDIRLLGDPSGATIIQCDGRLRFNFINATNLTITDIQFVSCGAPWRLISRESIQAEIPKDNPAALLLVNVHTLLMSNVVITYSQGYGMLCMNLFAESHIMNSNFTYNSKYSANGIGGSILLFYRDSSVYPKAELVRILVNNCIFSKCSLTYELSSPCSKMPSASGLGIVIKQSQYPIHVIVNYTNFTDNHVPVLAVYNHDTPASYSILIQHSCFIDSAQLHGGIYWKTATITFLNLLNEHRLRSNSTKATRMINIHNNVFNGSGNTKYSASIDAGYIDITVFLNVTITVKNCIFLAPITATAIMIHSILIGQRVYDLDYGAFVKIIMCNFKGLQHGAIIALVTPDWNFVQCYTDIIVSYNISIYTAPDTRTHNQLSLLIENTIFINNAGNAAIKVIQIGNVTMTDSQFIENKEMALESKGSIIYIRGTVTFLRNIGFDGGAISLTTFTKHTTYKSKETKSEQASFLYLHPNARLVLINNKATNKGGAIYVDIGEINDEERGKLCFYQLVGRKRNHLSKIILINNTADFAGDSVYGGFDQECYLQTWYRSKFKIEDFFAISNQLSMSEMATDPDELCFCHGSVPSCSMFYGIQVTLHPGQTVNIGAIAVGKNNHYRNYGASPALVIARIDPVHQTKLRNGQYGQNLGNRCSQLTYTVYSRNTFVEIQLSLIKIKFAGFIDITFLDCPFGFQLEDSPYPGCVCETIIEESGCTCSIDDLVIFCPFGKWIGNISSSAIVHHHCPLDYCTSERDVHVTVLDEQCAFNHSGLLCGECQPRLSLGFGSSICKECTNTYILLIFPFALAGLGLVLILFACNLTVSRGTINGLIYFANVVQVNSSIFVTQNTPQFLAVFITWVNLDFGIETCFYNGMDMYAKAWLQFVFPVYIWLIVAATVLLSRYSMTVSRLTRDNTVPVLATLFLLSYAKLLRAIITTFSFTYLRYPDGTDIPVWMYDGNVPFAKGKHNALLIAALIAMFGFIIPYTLLLLLSPHLQRWSHHKPLRWVNKLKPFLDANHGPYKNKLRNWMGIILLIRAVKFICFAANAEGDPNINLMVILLIGAVPPLMVWIFGTVYKSKINSILDSVFVLLLSTLASASLYIRTTSLDVERKQTTITMSIFAAAFSLFLIIVAYHSFILIKSTASKLFKRRNHLISDSSPSESSNKQDGEQNRTAPTVSYIALSELSSHDN